MFLFGGTLRENIAYGRLGASEAEILRAVARASRLLVLDEPTNDLDIDTLELLEELLQEYSGTVLIVSHDRTFLDNVVTQSIVFEGDGKLTEIVGGYGDWLAWKRQQTQAPAAKAEASKPVAATKPATKSRLNYKDARELEALPALIQQLETEQMDIAARLADPALYQTDAKGAAKLQARSEAIDAELLDALARWEALEAKQAG